MLDEGLKVSYRNHGSNGVNVRGPQCRFVL